MNFILNGGKWNHTINETLFCSGLENVYVIIFRNSFNLSQCSTGSKKRFVGVQLKKYVLKIIFSHVFYNDCRRNNVYQIRSSY